MTDTKGALRANQSTSIEFLIAAMSFVLSVTLWFAGDRRGVFVGRSVPTILAAGAVWTISGARST